MRQFLNDMENGCICLLIKGFFKPLCLKSNNEFDHVTKILDSN